MSDVLDNLKNATGNLKGAHNAVHEITERLTEAKKALAEAEERHTLAGLEGKNAETRKAELAALTQVEREAVSSAERAERAARLTVTLAELDYKLAREALGLHRAQLLSQAGGES